MKLFFYLCLVVTSLCYCKNSTVPAPQSFLRVPIYSRDDLYKAADIVISANVNNQDAKGQTILLFAVTHNEQPLVEKLLQAGANPDIAEKGGITPLFFAVAKGITPMVKLLLTYKSNPNAPFSQNGISNYTPLFIAAQNGHSDMIPLLIKAGAHVDVRNSEGATPLFVASQNGHLKAVKALLKHSASPHLAKSDGQTPLSIAIIRDHTEVVKKLLQAGANPNIRTVDNATSLHFAVRIGNREITQALIQHGANLTATLEAELNTPLQIASTYKHIDIIRLLVFYGTPFPQTDLAVTEDHAWAEAIFPEQFLQFILAKDIQKIEEHLTTYTGPQYSSIYAQGLLLAALQGFHDVVVLLLNYYVDIMPETFGRLSLVLAHPELKSRHSVYKAILDLLIAVSGQSKITFY